MEILFGITFLFGQLASLVSGSAHWSFLDVFASVSCGAFIIWAIRKPKAIEYGSLTPLIVVFVMISALMIGLRAGVNHAPISISDVLYLFRWAAYAGIYGFVLSQHKRAHWKQTLYVTGIGLACIGLVQLVLYPDLRNLVYLGWDPHFRRIFATLFDPNFTGVFYVLTFLVGLSLWDRRTSRLMVMVGQFVTFFALLLTYSRSSYIAFIIGIVVWFASARSYAKLFAMILIFSVMALLLNGSPEGHNLLRGTSALARLGSVSMGMRRVLQSPIIGTGFIPGGIDMSLLYIFASVGMFGGITYVMLIIKLFSTADRLLLSTLGSLLVHGLFTNSLFYPWVMAWVWILAAVTEKRTYG